MPHASWRPHITRQQGCCGAGMGPAATGTVLSLFCQAARPLGLACGPARPAGRCWQGSPAALTHAGLGAARLRACCPCPSFLRPQLGLPTGPTIALASALLEVVHVREGGFERQMLLTLHLLSLEPRMPCSPCSVAHAGAGDGDTEEELSGADGALGDEHAATDSGWGEAWSAAAAARAAQRVAPRQSQLAARILLALHRLQARRRLPAFLVDAILKWMLPQLGDQARLPTAGDADVEPAVLDRVGRFPFWLRQMCRCKGPRAGEPAANAPAIGLFWQTASACCAPLQLALLPPDSLLALYTLVAIVFGGAFRVPEDLGAPPPSQHAGRWDVGAADFAVRRSPGKRPRTEGFLWLGEAAAIFSAARSLGNVTIIARHPSPWLLPRSVRQ